VKTYLSTNDMTKWQQCVHNQRVSMPRWQTSNRIISINS